ncbi:MAG TPA: sodium:proton exchanger [Halieaceae bacterium]|mgnify:CR=1 FL=1|jgi:Kef-type K+ transport system membrane component KefB|uniref:cation:proton antiporter n=2 Tax=Halieaceae TaxID=1706372 RepID=UPI000C35E699|nr:cation:proton antiporter [Haliea sp.]HBQ40638.1 sodium:proton exchanger [Halieaceae bacterium]MAD62870.1 sodium:proton exchanger [Haliea sp.]MAY94412.1 sodium:proton exchanger [Haliea sp.]MBP69753.1 sodium:proton exchanger [Haliea sp.]HCD55439.1 sodium:proton exchanger [Halieaceae bacterium]|tara:strand:+ start:3056 stop:4699 length:1644 start_codon:yes stop_codon:yes gene_type:complete
MGLFPDVFTEIAVLLLFAAFVGAIGVRLRQPLIVAFIAVGIMVGPSMLGWVTADDQIDLLAQFGIALLLFVVGLKLDLHIIKTMGPVALATGLGQVAFTSIVGYLIAVAFGMPPVTALYVAVALTFSSTIIIVKLLSDKREVDSLHGRIALGFLIVQDLVVVLVMIGLNAMRAAEDVSVPVAALTVLLKGAVFLLFVATAMRYVLPKLTHMLSQSQELLVLFGIAWGLALAALGVTLGFSKEVGAFIAGVSLASTPYRDALGARLTSLRDFLLLFFFIDLGAHLDLGMLGAQLLESVVFSIFVLVGNPLIVLIIMGALGYRSRTGFLAGLTVAQISEFSLILGALGLSLGHISAETMGLITLVGLITISASTYMIIYSHQLYDVLAPWLQLFERSKTHREMSTQDLPDDALPQALLFGLGRYGFGIARSLRERGWRVLTVDINPDLTRIGDPAGYPVLFGDAEDPEFSTTLPLERVQWVISTAREKRANLSLLHSLKQQGYTGRTAITAQFDNDVAELEQAGADIVLSPFSDAACEAADRITEADLT